MEIILLEENGEVIRKVIKPTVQLSIDTGSIYVTGQEVLKLANNEFFTTQPTQLCQKHQTVPGEPVDPETEANNSAKEAAQDTCLEAIRAAVTTYVQACFAIDSQVTEGGAE